MNKKILFIGLGVIIFAALIGVFTTDKQEVQEYMVPLPDDVVKQYFTAWNDKRYQDMYATISDGFKKIEPTAKDLTTFKEYVDSQNIKKINIKKIEEKFNDGLTAQVEYLVEFILADDEKKEFAGTFTLKYRQGDIILGWKLIHPYGENIDAA